MNKVLISILVLSFCIIGFSATHVFWYKATTSAYSITDCEPGPCLDAASVIHEGMSATGTVAQHSGSSESGSFNFGSWLYDQQGRCAFYWSLDLSNATGTATAAKLRGEYKDGFAGNSMCNPGPISIRYGVADFQGNLDTWGGPDYVPETADWQDFLNPLSSSMGYDFMTPTLGAEETINVTAPESRGAEFNASVLDGQFFEVDVTEQVNHILTNQGSHAIVLLVAPNQGSTGKIGALASEDGVRPNGSDNPWSQDGNSMHLVVESSDLAMGAENSVMVMHQSTVYLGQNTPNPFKTSTAIAYNTGRHRRGKVKIYSPEGRLVYSEAIQGQGTIQWRSRDRSCGIYLCRLSAGRYTVTRKMILMQ
jgi:hypothetical protein